MKYIVAFAFFFLFSSFASAKDWTILIWLNGNNSLEQYVDMNSDQIRSAMPTIDSQIDVVAMVATGGKSNYTHFGASVDKDEISNEGKIDGGDYKEVVNFIKWGVDKYPAKHYFLILWDHGSGWTPMLGKGGIFNLFDVSVDEYTNHVILTNQIHLIFDEIKPIHIDVLGYDACLMAEMETNYEARSVDYVVASEETEPGAGWPYDKMFPALKDRFEPSDFSKSIVKAYLEAYTDDSATMSAIDMAKYNEFLPKFKEWVGTVDVTLFKKAKKNALSFTISSTKDLGQILSMTNSSDLLEEYNAMFLAAGGTGYVKDATGMAIDAPSKGISKDYEKLDFAIDFPEYLQLLKK